jgi:hypothetical protein
MNCWNCFNQVRKNMRYCPHCGVKLNQDEVSELRRYTQNGNKTSTIKTISGELKQRTKYTFLVLIIGLSILSILLASFLFLSLTGKLNPLTQEIHGDIAENIPNNEVKRTEIATKTITEAIKETETIATTDIIIVEEKTSSLFTKSNESLATPEEVMTQFTEYIKNNDFESALNLFAINHRAENFDFNGYLYRLQSFIPWNSMAPAEYEPYSVLNKAFLLRNASNQIKGFVYSLLFPEHINEGTILINKIEEENWDILNLLDPSRLSNLRFIRTDLVAPEIQLSERHQNNVKAMGDIFGFLDQKDYYVLYEFEGKNYWGSFTIGEYEEGWQINYLNSNLGGGDILGCVKEITEEEYLEMIQ